MSDIIMTGRVHFHLNMQQLYNGHRFSCEVSWNEEPLQCLLFSDLGVLPSSESLQSSEQMDTGLGRKHSQVNAYILPLEGF